MKGFSAVCTATGPMTSVCPRIEALRFEVVEFDREDARKAGELRASLAASGTPIGPYDVLIAGQALARGLVLITHNMREFRRVPDLAIEDWE
jgi:tRNA(fMet)-specific endonuclease VapC